MLSFGNDPRIGDQQPDQWRPDLNVDSGNSVRIADFATVDSWRHPVGERDAEPRTPEPASNLLMVDSIRSKDNPEGKFKRAESLPPLSGGCGT